MRKTGFLVVAVAVVSACSAPGGAPPPTAAVAVPAPSAVASAAPAASGSRAKTCSINGLSWQKWDTKIDPTMVVSNDGYCGTNVHLKAFTGVLMHVASEPSHGRITTAGEDTSLAGFRYHPDEGYVGPDAFVMVTGSAVHEVLANFTVTVSN